MTGISRPTVSRIFAFEEGGHLQQYEGNYSDYAAAKSMETQEFDSITEPETAAEKKHQGKGASLQGQPGKSLRGS